MEYRGKQSNSFKLGIPHQQHRDGGASTNHSSKTMLRGQKSAGRRVAENNFLLIHGAEDNNLQQPIRNSLIALSHEGTAQAAMAVAFNKSTDRNHQASYYGAPMVSNQVSHDTPAQLFATSHEHRQLLIEKLPQRPETSTGSKAKQVLLLQKLPKQQKALQQVYGQASNAAQRRDSSIDQASAKSRSTQGRAQSLTNVYSRKEKKDPGAHGIQVSNNQASKFIQHQNQVPFYNNQSLLQPRAVAGDLATEPSTHLHQQLSAIRSGEGFLESPQRPGDSHHATTTQSSAAGTANASASYGQSSTAAGAGTRLRMQNLGQISEAGTSSVNNPGVSQSTRLDRIDFTQMLYFQNAQMAQNESRRTSHGGGTAMGCNNGMLSENGVTSGHLITITNQQQDLPTPLSLSFANANQSKKLRNLKNFSAQSAAIAGSAAVHESNSMLTSLQQPSNQPQIAANQNMLQSFKLSELKNQQAMAGNRTSAAQDQVLKQGSVKNMRRNTATHTTSKQGSQIVQMGAGTPGQMAGPLCQIGGVVQPKGGGGTRYKSNKQAAGSTAKKMTNAGPSSSKGTTMALYAQNGVVQQRGTSQGPHGEVGSRSGHSVKGKSFVHNGGAQSFFEGKRIYSTNQPRAQSLAHHNKGTIGRQSFKQLQEFHDQHQFGIGGTGDIQQDLIAQYKSAQAPPSNFRPDILKKSVQQDNFFQQMSGIQMVTSGLPQQALKQKMQNLMSMTANAQNAPPSQLSSKSHAQQASGTTSNMSGLVTVPQSTAVPQGSSNALQSFTGQSAGKQYSHQLLQAGAPRGSMRNQSKALGQKTAQTGGASNGNKAMQSANGSASGTSAGNFGRKLTTGQGSLQQQYQALSEVATVIGGAISQAQGPEIQAIDGDGSISGGYSLAQQSKTSAVVPAKYSEEIKSLKSTLIQSQSPTFVKSGGNICLGHSGKRAGTAAGSSHQQSVKQTRLSHGQRLKQQALPQNERYGAKDVLNNQHVLAKSFKEKKRDGIGQPCKSPTSQFQAYLGEETTDQRVSHAISYHAQGASEVNQRRPMTTTHGTTSSNLVSQQSSPIKQSNKHLISKEINSKEAASRQSRKSLAEPKLKNSTVVKDIAVSSTVNPKKTKAMNLEAMRRTQENNWIAYQQSTGPGNAMSAQKPSIKGEKLFTQAQQQSQVYQIYSQKQKIANTQNHSSGKVPAKVSSGTSSANQTTAILQSQPKQLYVYQQNQAVIKVGGNLLASANRAATPGQPLEDMPTNAQQPVPVKLQQKGKTKIVKLQARPAGQNNPNGVMTAKTRKDFAKIIHNQRMNNERVAQTAYEKNKAAPKNKNRFSQEFGGISKDTAHRRQVKTRSGAIGSEVHPTQFSYAESREDESLEDTANALLMTSKGRRSSNTNLQPASEREETPLSSSSPTTRKQQARQNYPSSLHGKNAQFIVGSMENYAEMLRDFREGDVNVANIPLRSDPRRDDGSRRIDSSQNNSALRNPVQQGKNSFSNGYVNFRKKKASNAEGNDGMKTEGNSKDGDLIKIQDNNFSGLGHHGDGEGGRKSKNVTIDKASSNSSGLNWAQPTLGGLARSFESRKRLVALRKEQNQNRLKEISQGPLAIEPQVSAATDSKRNSIAKSHEMYPQDFDFSHSGQAKPGQIDDGASSQTKKRPQVPSLASKIQQAQKQAQRQHQQFSENPSANVSGVSTIAPGVGAQVDQVTVGAEYSQNGNNPTRYGGPEYEEQIQRKNSSVLSTANRNHFMINTPSALGYTSVLLGGTTNNTAAQVGTNKGLLAINTALGLSFTYNLQSSNDPEQLAQQIIFNNDRCLIDQYRQNEEFKAAVDPLGEASEPFMKLPYQVRLQNYVDSDDEQTALELPWEL